ncbi:MAG: serine/threonine protein kinase [Clostridiaceae bacterium]
MNIDKFIDLVDKTLLPYLKILSVDPDDPIEVEYIPEPWKFVGCGNYAAVFYHPHYKDLVVKIYAEGKAGIEEEIKVYEKLGDHPSFSKCYFSNDKYLVLKKLKGLTLYQCLKEKVFIPKNVIKDIDNALEYARSVGLYPHDVHAKNVMMMDNKGIVVDVSDFLKKEKCYAWDDFKKVYYKLYLKIFYKIYFPEILLNFIRKIYRIYRRLTGKM